MWFLQWLDSWFSFFWDASDYFSEAEDIVAGWVYPLYYLATPLAWLSYTFRQMATIVAHFHDWVYEINNAISTFLTQQGVWNAFNQYFKWADWAWGWVQGAASWFTNNVGLWWSGIRLTYDNVVTAWNNFWNYTWPQWMSNFNTLSVAWDNFWVVTLPTLADWDGVSSLITSAFTIRESWWKGWQDWRDKVVEFFTDPVEFIWTKFTDWFLGKE